jgi:hypothetical protein
VKSTNDKHQISNKLQFSKTQCSNGFGHFKIDIRYICQNISSMATYNEKKITKFLKQIYIAM